jgi:hypothetical protein
VWCQQHVAVRAWGVCGCGGFRRKNTQKLIFWHPTAAAKNNLMTDLYSATNEMSGGLLPGLGSLVPKNPLKTGRSTCWLLGAGGWGPRGSLLNFLWCSLDPPTFASAIKCHQKSTSNSAGSSVGSLAPPPGHPAARRCVRAVPVLPLLLRTRPARARPSIGGQSPTPAPRQLPWSPPRGW